ncbi:MAG: hypothetical protein FJ015_02725 [Chloroflexi bacterium]|nr:hypothetical protein [Chloroflexota bacterium]
MPKKTRRGRAFRSKKKRAIRPEIPVTTAMPATAGVAAPSVTTPSPGVHAAKTKVTAVKYPYVLAELYRIGILAGVIVVILIILALVL